MIPYTGDWLWLWSTGAVPVETREKLESLEGHRKTIRLRAKNCRLSFVSLLHLTGTVTPRILTNALTWTSISIYLIWRTLSNIDKSPTPSQFVPYVTLSELSPLISFVVFLFVFLNSSTFSQFYDQYNISMSLEGRVFDTCLLARSFMPQEYSFRIWRRINAAHCLGYVGLTQGRIFSRANYLDTMIEEHQLLTSSELARINEIDPTVGGSAFREVLAWIIQDIKDYISSLSESKDQARLLSETSIAREMIQQILMFRGKMGALYDYADMPVPLIYRHLVVAIAWTFLPLYCFAVAENSRFNASSKAIDLAFAEILSALCVAMMIFFVVGSRLVGDALSDPYGRYLEDLTVLQYSTFTAVASRKVLMASKFEKTTLDQELGLESRRPHLGSAWYGFDEDIQVEEEVDVQEVEVITTAASTEPLLGSPKTSSKRVSFFAGPHNQELTMSRKSSMPARRGLRRMDANRSLKIVQLAAEGLE